MTCGLIFDAQPPTGITSIPCTGFLCFSAFLRGMEDKGDMVRVCVTGAGGYIGSWVVKFLLSKGYIVHGTVRDPCDPKNSHLKKFEKASENLLLFKTDLMDQEDLCAAFAGCSAVLHVASPVPFGPVSNPEVELIEPAVTGTRNVLSACEKGRVKRVVVVSSAGAVTINPSWPKDVPMDEACWSNLESCKSSENYYCLAKTLAESEALEHGKKSELNVVTVCPSFVFGPMLQPTLNSSSMVLRSHIKDTGEPVKNALYPVVDVRDVAESILLVLENPDAVGRYISSSYSIRAEDLVEKLKSMYPNFNYPKSFIEEEGYGNLNSEKLQKLGWKCRPLEETLVDAVENFLENGFLVED